MNCRFWPEIRTRNQGGTLGKMLLVRRIKHRELHNKGKSMREFDTEDLVVVRKHVKSSRKDGIDQELVLKKKGPYRVLEKATLISY